MQTTIITSADHFALAPGKLINQWQEGTRRGFHYETQAPVANVAHLISTSMPYLQKKIEQTSVKVFYPSGKQQHGQKHLAAIQDTLQYATDHFGQYDYAQFNLVPASVALPTVGYALPQMALIGEGVGFHANLNESDGFDHLYRRTVHEVAHQWWGYGLNIAEVEGSGVLAETLAKYTELVILRRKYGQDYVKRLVEFEQGRYFQGRSRDTIKELPLYRADSNYLIYSKGSAAMYGVSELLGETRVNQALRKLLTSHAPPAPPATTLDLIRYLNEVASESEQAVINSWFKEIHVNDVAIESVSIKHQNSEYNVTVCVIDHQEASHSVQLSAFAANGKLIEMKEFAKSAVNPACLDWTLMSKPKYFEVDAKLLLLDSNRENNIYQVPNR